MVRINSTIEVHNANSLIFLVIDFSSLLIKNVIIAPINGVIITDDNIGKDTKKNTSKVDEN